MSNNAIPRPTRLPRRQFLCLLTMAGGGILLAACGGQSVPTASLPSVAVAASPSIVASPTLAAGTPAPRASTPAAGAPTPVRPGPATPTRAELPPGSSDLQRMLTLVPRRTDESKTVFFADVARQKQNHGFAGAISLADAKQFKADQWERWNRTIGSLPLSEVAGVDLVRLDPLPVVGFDFWQIDREISVGRWPERWGWIEGRLDREAITRALTARGYTTTSHRGQAILSYGPDEQQVLQIGSNGITSLQYLNRAVPVEGGLATASTTSLIEAEIDASTGNGVTFADSPDYAALALALGPVVAAVLDPGERYFRPVLRTGTPTPTIAGPKLHRYRLVGTALRDDGRTSTMLITLLYERDVDARAAAPILHQRLLEYGFTGGRRPLRDFAAVGEPVVASVGAYAALTVPLAIRDEASHGYLSFWFFLAGDMMFLAEGG